MDGKVAIVTGGTRGVGRGITERLLDEGADVVVCGRTEPAEPIARALFVAADVRVPEQIDRVVSHTLDRFGRIDVLVNNAGGSPHCLVADASPGFLTKIIALNLTAPLLFARAVNAVMQQGGGGSIVNIGSVSGFRQSPGTAAYGAAKAGLSNLTKSLAAEWAPKVRVNCVVAGPIVTEQAELHFGDEEGIAAVGRTIPMGRMATPSDVAEAVVWLASDRTGYVTGTDVMVHGGGERPAWMDASNAAALSD
jgi:NAD(P)-dependent dehydrogenase (short-subunit alcohol dehydrogenase family)